MVKFLATIMVVCIMGVFPGHLLAKSEGEIAKCREISEWAGDVARERQKGTNMTDLMDKVRIMYSGEKRDLMLKIIADVYQGHRYHFKENRQSAVEMFKARWFDKCMRDLL